MHVNIAQIVITNSNIRVLFYLWSVEAPKVLSGYSPSLLFSVCSSNPWSSPIWKKMQCTVLIILLEKLKLFINFSRVRWNSLSITYNLWILVSICTCSSGVWFTNLCHTINYKIKEMGLCTTKMPYVRHTGSSITLNWMNSVFSSFFFCNYTVCYWICKTFFFI